MQTGGHDWRGIAWRSRWSASCIRLNRGRRFSKPAVANRFRGESPGARPEDRDYRHGNRQYREPESNILDFIGPGTGWAGI